MREKLVERPDRIVARIAARQHGVIATAQLVAAGPDMSAVARPVASGWLHRVHRGVYVVGHARLSRKGRWKAATLACGDGAALSHRSAAELWGMLDPIAGAVHVTVPVAGGRARRDGIRVHRSPSLTETSVTRRDRIAVTRPQPTLDDLRGSVSPGVQLRFTYARGGRAVSGRRAAARPARPRL